MMLGSAGSSSESENKTETGYFHYSIPSFEPGSWAGTRGLCETPFPVYLSESLVFGAVETHALAASSEGGLTEVTAPESEIGKST
ncbi:hypothetical protein G4B88_002370 (mitochondrion) [Cannabis sativa]|uniref:Uncharacterized protein n=1 Tax=Cannabis sativa TaxID=3483 RepID=A0A7J6DV33_CANSA|nr:hypothetical protein G4B88_002370 [Cannabis sativa]